MNLGKFEILEEIGSGGFGVVYKARDQVLNRLVAIKVLHPGLVIDQNFVKRFKREAQITANLDHPNLVPVHDFGESEGRYFIVMSYMPGGSLKDLLRREGPIPPEKALPIFKQICEGLSYAHSKNVIDRDLKPGNILFDERGNVRISDLGFAKLLQSDASHSMTTSGAFVGTPAYMATEIWNGKEATPATDVYSLACTFIEMLTGKPLFDGETTPLIMQQHFLPLNLPDNLPEEWKVVFEKALEKNPQDRIQNIDEFYAQITKQESITEKKPYTGNSSANSHPPEVNYTNPNIDTSTHKQQTKFRFSFLPIAIIFITILGVLIWYANSFPRNSKESVEQPAEQSTKEPTEEKTVVDELAVGIVLPTKDEPRWIQDETRFKNALTEQGYSVEVLFSQGDPAIEKQNVETLISKGIQVLIICPHDAAAAAGAAEVAHDAGVKVISYDRLIRDTDAIDYYVTFDPVAIGETQAQYLVDNANGTGLPLYLYAGSSYDDYAFLFFEGAWNVLQPKIADGTFVIQNSTEAVALQYKAVLARDEMGKIIGQVTTNWDFNVAKGLAEANLTAATAKGKGEVFILAPNDGTARAIADAFGADDPVTKFHITGQDAEKASVQYIIDGKQSMTVLKDVRTMVNDAVDVAARYMIGSIPPETTCYNNNIICVPSKPSNLVTVTQDNVKRTVIESGFYEASEFSGLD